MSFWSNILFWVGIIFMTDGSLAILFQERWKKLFGELNIQRIALIEIGVALVLLAAHFLLDSAPA